MLERAQEVRLTPMMRQYLDAKAVHPGAILMFRMGDFFEMFFEDAVTAARELDLTLTSRDKEGAHGAIPMAGVPHHAVTQYIAKLVARGHTVVLCDQVEDPRQAKGLVRREITRIVTPGTIADLEALDPAAKSYLACVVPAGETLVVGMLDLLAGEVLLSECAPTELQDELGRMSVAEVLVEEGTTFALGLPTRVLKEPLADARAEALVRERLGPSEVWGLAAKSAAATRALARLILFAEGTQRKKLVHLSPPRIFRPQDTLVLDEVTRRNLELTRTELDGERQGSLLAHLDRTRTAQGARLLRQWLLFPLGDAPAIGLRLDSVEKLVRDPGLGAAVREELAQVRDVERLIGRLALGRATPRDLGAVRTTLCRLPELKRLLAMVDAPLGERWATGDSLHDLRELLARALVDDPPPTSTDGGIFRRGYRVELDALIALSKDGHGFLAELEERERRRTGIANLRVRYNKVFGYYIEVTRSNLKAVPADYVRKQTLTGAERFITPELKAFEERVLGADEERKAAEVLAFAELCEQVVAHLPRLREAGRLLAETDAIAALAEVAHRGRYVRPELRPEPVLELIDSRHPVIETLLPVGERFVPNDLRLAADGRQLMILTGPNMAGKSTVMRQAALITLLAHMGSFVPAKRAVVGLTDRIFTRVGAADNLGRGRSTFMVEMLQTAAILRQATRASLVLLDEIGRGTSTYDGLSIAWAVAEHLHDVVGCRTLFATHYHELTDLDRERPRIINARVAVHEEAGGIVFLRKLEDGRSGRSFGIEVAALARLPLAVVARARAVLRNLEADELDPQGRPRLAHPECAPRPAPVHEEVAARLRALDPARTTPLEALQLLYRLKEMIEGGS